MRRVALSYALHGDSDTASGGLVPHPLVAVLSAVQDTGSISGAARRMGLSYRHVWGSLKRWEAEFGEPLVSWVRGQPARLAPAGTRLLQAERLAQARLAPQLDAVRQGIAQAFRSAFDGPLPTLTVCGGHDPLLLLLRDLAGDGRPLDVQIIQGEGAAALAALDDGRAVLAWLPAIVVAGSAAPPPAPRSPRPQADTLHHIGVATRTLGLLVAPGNPLKLAALADLTRPGLRFVGREPGSSAQRALEDLLQWQGLEPAALQGRTANEPTQLAVAEMVAAGRADAGLGDEALALGQGLDFVPLAQEACCLVLPQAHLEQPAVAELLELLHSPAWRHALEELPGVRPWKGAQVLSPAELPAWRAATTRSR